MQNDVYVVIGRTTGDPCEVWGVAMYDNEDEALSHSEKAAEETRRIQANIQRASKLRGKPFPEDMLERFRAGNRYDPQMRLSGVVVYEVVRVQQAGSSA